VSDDSGEAALEQRVERLETGQSQVLAKLDQLLGLRGKGGQGDDGETAPGGRPDVAEQVRLELARAEQEKAAAAKAEAEKQEHETLRQRLAKLTEVTPAPPQPRRQRAMWGRR